MTQSPATFGTCDHNNAHLECIPQGPAAARFSQPRFRLPERLADW